MIHPYKTMMGVFLVAVLILFATITLLFMNGSELSKYFDFSFPIWTWIGLGILGVSSFTFESARTNLRIGNYARSRQSLSLTMVLGIVFVGTQMAFFADLFAQQILITPYNSAAYLYILTGLHATHIFAGLIVLFLAARAIKKRPDSPRTAVHLSVGGFFWHFLGALWLYLVLIMFTMR